MTDNLYIYNVNFDLKCVVSTVINSLSVKGTERFLDSIDYGEKNQSIKVECF